MLSHNFPIKFQVLFRFAELFINKANKWRNIHLSEIVLLYSYMENDLMLLINKYIYIYIYA